MKTGLGRCLTCTLVVVLALGVAACNKGGDSAKKLRLAFVTNNPSDFWTIARKGTEKAAAELSNVEVEFQMPGDGTAAGQQRIVDDLVAKGVDGMAISPVDPKNQTQLLNRVASQALVITQDSDAPASNRTCYIGTNNVAAGEQAGQLVKEALPQSGNHGLCRYARCAERQGALRRAAKGTGRFQHPDH
jgi:ribose transport system substrate-binding protein